MNNRDEVMRRIGKSTNRLFTRGDRSAQTRPSPRVQLYQCDTTTPALVLVLVLAEKGGCDPC